MTEWPLVLFTIALQLACGLSLSATLFDLLSGKPGSPRRIALAADIEAMRPLGIAVFPTVTLGLLASLFHLGHPFSALRSLSNLGSSRLSLEILLSLLFAAAALVYGSLWWRRIIRARLAAGVITSILGVSAVASSFFIYMIPAQPAWNSGWVPASFLGMILLFAGIVPASLLDSADRVFPRIALALTASGALALAASMLWTLAALSRSGVDGFSADRLQAGLRALAAGNPVWVGLYLAFSVVLPVAFVFRSWPGEDSGAPAEPRAFSLKIIVFFSVLAGAIIGRMLMYTLAALPF